MFIYYNKKAAYVNRNLHPERMTAKRGQIEKPGGKTEEPTPQRLMENVHADE
jgi:hypothetical protein